MFSIKNLLKVTMICLCASLSYPYVATAYELEEVIVTGSGGYKDKLKKMSDSELASEQSRLEETINKAVYAPQLLEMVKAERNTRPTMAAAESFTPGTSTLEEDAAILGNTQAAAGFTPGTSTETEDAAILGNTTTAVTTIINNNGNVTTTEGAGKFTPGTSTEAEDAAILSNTPAATGFTPGTSTEAEDAAILGNTPTQKYTGVYNGRQLIPELMAQHCKITEEKLKEIAKDPRKLEECVIQYLTEMNSKEKNAQAQALKDYNMLRFATLLDVQTAAIAQTGNVNNYEETMNKYGQATMEADTKFDMEGALTNTQAFSTDVMNGIRTLYAEFLKYAAIDGFATIDKKAFVNEEETPNPNTPAKPVSTTGTVNEHAVTATATITDDVAYAEVKGTYDPTTQKCSVNGTTGACANGTYEDKDGNFWDCEHGKCTKQHMLEDVVVTAGYDSYFSNLEKMGLHQYAGEKEQIAKITADLQKIVNDKNASQEQKKRAQELLDKLKKIDESKKITIEGVTPGTGTVDISNIPANNVPGLDAAIEFTSFIQFNATNPNTTPEDANQNK